MLIISIISVIVTVISVLTALYLGILNLRLIRSNQRFSIDEIMFNTVTSNLNAAIEIIEKLKLDNKNDSVSWHVTAEQLSSFHNIAINIENNELRKCYCGKLHSFMLRIRNILNDVDDFRFYFGLQDYKNKNVEDLFLESYDNYSHISVNALSCIVQFLSLFHGAKGDYMYNKEELYKILRPVVYGFIEIREYSDEEINKMPTIFSDIHKYMKEWRIGVRKLRNNRQNK